MNLGDASHQLLPPWMRNALTLPATLGYVHNITYEVSTPKSNQPLDLTIHLHRWKDWCWSWSSNTVATWWEELTHWKKPWYWERLKAGGEGGDRGWAGSIASLTQWPWVWANSRRWWRTEKPGKLQSMESQRVGHHLPLNIHLQEIWGTVGHINATLCP